MSPGDKNNITHLGRDFSFFLGHYLQMPTLVQHSRSKQKIANTAAVYHIDQNPKKAPSILIPINYLKSKLIDGYQEDPGPRPCGEEELQG